MENKTIILWDPHPKQLEIANHPARFKVVRCGRRWGKTTYTINYLTEEALLNANGLYFYIGPTYRQAKMIAWEMLINIITKRVPKELIRKVNESELYVLFANGSKIAIKGADNPDSLRGVGLNGAVLDEYADMRPDVFSKIIRPALADKQGWAVFIGTPKGFNHFYDLYVKAESRPNWAVFHFRSKDNPLLPPQEIEEARLESDEDEFAQEWEAEFRRMKGLVFKDFDRELHTYDKLPDVQIIERIAGVDFGHTNPAAIPVIYKDFDNNYFVEAEWYERNKTDAEIVERAVNLQDVHKIGAFYPDPENAGIIKQLRDAGLPCHEVDKGSGSVKRGISRIVALFRSGKLKINKNCTNLIWEIERYHYPTKVSDVYNPSELPVKKDDHAIDALRYALVTNLPTELRKEDGEDEEDMVETFEDDFE